MFVTILKLIFLQFFWIFFVNGFDLSLNVEQNQYCQLLKCNLTREICRKKVQCPSESKNEISSCFFCAVKENENFEKSSSLNRIRSEFSTEKINTTIEEKTFDETYDEYYEYEQDKNDVHEYNEYLGDYNDKDEENLERTKISRKLGQCPPIVEAVGRCDEKEFVQPDCQLDSNCPGDLKCCPAACGKRSCQQPIQNPIEICPKTFHCSLNCPLGFRVDGNGCLLCQCQSCPSMEKCEKRCGSGYLKDLFNCEICECRDRCPTFNCDLRCSSNVGFVYGENGCPLCQCASSTSKPIGSSSSCQKDVHCPIGFRCVHDEQNVPMCQQDASDLNSLHAVVKCQQTVCRSSCGPSGYKLDAFGCPSCVCSSRDEVRCSNLMCRISCEFGFKRDENGCETCSCADSPIDCPMKNCRNPCGKYRKDEKGCPTCDCECPTLNCPFPKENCLDGLEKGKDFCPICKCSEKCSTKICKISCPFGFRRDSRRCPICECDWTPIDDKIPCDKFHFCPGTRVCNFDLNFCEKVDPERVNWFVYKFDGTKFDFSKRKLFDKLKTGLIENIASKYEFQPNQIVVSSIEPNGDVSFQIIPFFSENLEIFEEKINKIDFDLNSHEFQKVFPSIVELEEEKIEKSFLKNFWSKIVYLKLKHESYFIFVVGLLLIVALTILAISLVKIFRKSRIYSNLSDSKSPIFEALYRRTQIDEERPATGAYVIVPTEDQPVETRQV